MATKKPAVTLTIKSTEKSELDNREMEEAIIDLPTMEVRIKFKEYASGESNHFFLRELKKYLTTYEISNLDKLALLYSIILNEDREDIFKKMISHPLLIKEIDTHLTDTLSPRELNIIKNRFGIGKLRQYSLLEVARGLGVTRERIRQLELKALRIIKNPAKLKKILPFFTRSTSEKDKNTIN